MFPFRSTSSCFLAAFCILSLPSLRAELPKDVQAAIDKRNRAIEKIDRHVSEELRKMKAKHTTAGNLDVANAVMRELERHEVQNPDQDAALRKIAGEWVSEREYYSRWTFNVDGSGSWMSSRYSNSPPKKLPVRVIFDVLTKRYMVTWGKSKQVKEIISHDPATDTLKVEFFGRETIFAKAKEKQ